MSELGKCRIGWCGEDAARLYQREEDRELTPANVAGYAPVAYCERHARERETYGAARPDPTRARHARQRLRGVEAVITVWERGDGGPPSLRHVAADPAVLGRVCAALAALMHLRVTSIDVTAHALTVRVAVMETWGAEDLESLRRELEDAAIGAATGSTVVGGACEQG